MAVVVRWRAVYSARLNICIVGAQKSWNLCVGAEQTATPTHQSQPSHRGSFAHPCGGDRQRDDTLDKWRLRIRAEMAAGHTVCARVSTKARGSLRPPWRASTHRAPLPPRSSPLFDSPVSSPFTLQHHCTARPLESVPAGTLEPSCGTQFGAANRRVVDRAADGERRGRAVGEWREQECGTHLVWHLEVEMISCR